MYIHTHIHTCIYFLDFKLAAAPAVPQTLPSPSPRAPSVTSTLLLDMWKQSKHKG